MTASMAPYIHGSVSRTPIRVPNETSDAAAQFGTQSLFIFRRRLGAGERLEFRDVASRLFGPDVPDVVPIDFGVPA